MLIAVFTAFVLCRIAYPFYIKWLVSKQLGQFIREEGPASHAVKAKTPTMGGLCFIVGILISSVFTMAISGVSSMDMNETFRAGLTLLAAVACGLLGLADDYGKVTSKSNAGISAKFRLFSEFSIGMVLGLLLLFFQPCGTDLTPALVLGITIDPLGFTTNLLPAFSGPLQMVYCLLLCPFLMAACSNALNLHDGMDGLAGGTSMMVLATMGIMLCTAGHLALAWLAFAGVGALLAFLIFNKYPAKVFMGDTGSLFLGALMAGLVVCGGLLIWFVPMALIYIAETISVMAQVTYFKLTKPYTPDKPMSPISLAIYKLTHKLPGQGKRLLRMAPIHHHFEAIAGEKGKPETTVVEWFWLVQLALCSACFYLFKR